MRYRFVDCRWELGDPERGRALYLAGHIPGAAFLDVDRDLSAPPGPGGRHPLPAAEDFAAAASRAGIGPGVLVVAYGSMGGAERLWWLLRHFGHEDVAVLDGGIEAWRGPLATGEEEIENDERVRTLERQLEPMLAIAGDIDSKALGLERPREKRRDPRLVLDDQDSHSTPCHAQSGRRALPPK